MLAFLPFPLNAKNLPIAWDPNTEPDIAGYILYYGEYGKAPNRITVFTPEAKLIGLTAGRTYLIYVTAFNSGGIESPPSESVFYTVPAHSLSATSIEKISSSRAQIVFTGSPYTLYQVEAASDLTSKRWHVINYSISDKDGRVYVIDPLRGSQRFYRARRYAR